VTERFFRVQPEDGVYAILEITTMRKNVLLIWPYNKHSVDIQETFPIGIGYIISNLEKSHDVTFADCTLDNIHPESDGFAALLSEVSPDIVGISFWSSNAQMVYATVSQIRKTLPESKVVFGGPHATAYGEYEIKNENADFVISGEAELSFPMLVDIAGTDDYQRYREIPGLIYRDPFGMVHVNAIQYEKELDRLGEVDYNRLRLSDYHDKGYHYSGAAVLHHDLKTALIITTRGCPYRCRFCAAPQISGKKIRTHSPEYVSRTIRHLHDEFGVKSVALGDDNFTLKKRFAMEMCKSIIDLNIEGLVLSAPNGIRLTKMDEELAQHMRMAGFEEVAVAPESGSPRTLELMEKDTEIAYVKPFVVMCHNVGLKVKANFIIGYPGERLEDVKMTEQFILDNDFDQIGLCFFQPLPGPPIFDDLVARGEIEDSFVPGRYNQLTYCPKDLDENDLCDAFNKIMNGFRDSKGWKYKNARVGTIR
jgi:anaerobic magnesium-protoporphyrin IX monomethyl ester cyclase